MQLVCLNRNHFPTSLVRFPEEANPKHQRLSQIPDVESLVDPQEMVMRNTCAGL